MSPTPDPADTTPGGDHPAAARDHALHADLVISVCHRRPDGSTPGAITPRISWDWDVTPVQRIQLTEAAMSALADAHTQAMAQHLDEPEVTE